MFVRGKSRPRSDFGFRISDCSDFGFRISDYELRITNYELRTCRFPIVGRGMRIAKAAVGGRSQEPGARSRDLSAEGGFLRALSASVVKTKSPSFPRFSLYYRV